MCLGVMHLIKTVSPVSSGRFPLRPTPDAKTGDRVTPCQWAEFARPLTRHHDKEAEATNPQLILQIGYFSLAGAAALSQENQAALTFRRQACSNGSV